MSFLAPLFLLGAAAISLPVIFHLIRRTTRERQVFSSLMFLMPSPPRLTRRSRLEHILLLLLRCAALLLFAVGFARPFLRHAGPGAPSGPGQRTVVLLDTSASMRRADLWPEARGKCLDIIRKASPLDEVAVVTFDRAATPLMTFEEWKALGPADRVAAASARLASTNPGWFSTRTGNALISAAEMLNDNSGKSGPARGHIVLITDFQEGSHIEQVQGYEWPRGVDCRLELLKPKKTDNAGIQLVSDENENVTGPESLVRVRVSNSAASRREQFRIGWADAAGRGITGKPLDIYVPPGQARVFSLPVPTNRPATEILLEGDGEPFDNAAFVVPPEKSEVTVLYFGNESDRDTREPLYFLQRAFGETRRQSVHVRQSQANRPVTETDLRNAPLFVLSGPVSPDLETALKAQVWAGKTLLLCMKNAGTAATLAHILGISPPSCDEAHPANYAMLSDIDFRHPLFVPFADPRFSDFTRIHFWNYRRLDVSQIPGARVVAKFDDGAPAILDVAAGRGRLLVFTSGWQPADSQLAVSSKFVPLMYGILEQSGAAAPASTLYHIGDSLPVAATESGQARITSPLGVASGVQGTNFAGTAVPGIYIVNSGSNSRRFAVNLDASESRTVALPFDELEHLGVPLSSAASSAIEASRAVRVETRELESRQKLWRWFIIATLSVLLLETFLAGRASRGRSPEQEAAI